MRLPGKGRGGEWGRNRVRETNLMDGGGRGRTSRPRRDVTGPGNVSQRVGKGLTVNRSKPVDSWDGPFHPLEDLL